MDSQLEIKSKNVVKRAYSVANLVMSPSWNFPAQAEPSYEGSEPSQAGAL